ncbi:MAG: LysR substrate-binding domain-containing protein [Sandaracinaceae bacterium]
MDLNDYFYFVHVVEKRGFAPAGRALGVPKSRLSRHVQQLEDRLGARLIQRTSRQFAVTDVGETFYRFARAALDEVDAAEAAVRRQTNTLAGRVRLTCSVGMAHFALREVVVQFLVDNPKVDIVQHVTNRAVDLVEGGFDMAIRAHTGPLPDSGLVQRRLASTPWHLFAGPAYLESAGAPASPAALGGHTGLKLGYEPEQGSWSLRGPGGASVTVPYEPRLCSDDMVTLKDAATAGMGIVGLPAYICRDDVESGWLVRVLPEWTAGDAEISLLLPSRRGVMPAVRALAEHLQQVYPHVTRLSGGGADDRP